MRRRSQAIASLVMIVAVALAAVAIGWWIAGYLARSSPQPAALDATEQPERVPTRRAVHLYFGDARGRYLMAEQRILDQPADDVVFIGRLVEALIQGPEKDGSRTLPAGAKVRAVYLNESGTAFIDFDSSSFADHPGGVGAELLSIYSIVNTLVLNVDRIRSVKILIGGQEATTLAGHVDLLTPFEVDMLWVR